MQTTEEAARTAPVVTASVPAVVTRPVPDGPAEERAANRDRTPPPSGNRAKAVEQMSIIDLVGPRKTRAAAAKSKAAPKAAA